MEGGNGATGGKVLILTTPYEIAARSAVFREKYKEHIGYSIQAAEPSVMQLGVNAAEVSKATECLGFKSLQEDMAEHLVPDEERLSLLVLASRDNPALHGTSYLVLKSPVNHSPVTCCKWLLTRSLRNIEKLIFQDSKNFLAGSGNSFSYEFFVPLTLCLDDADLETTLTTQPGTYLAKPVRGAKCQQKQLVRFQPGRAREDLLTFLLTSQLNQVNRSQVILQKYIERPLLIDKRKFDIRAYLMAVNPKRGGNCGGRPMQSGYFVFLHPGHVRLCSAPYDRESVDLAAHLAGNPSAQQSQRGDCCSVSQLAETTTWYPDELNVYLNRKGRMPHSDWAQDVLYQRVGATIGYLAAVLRCHLDDRTSSSNTFRILSVDLLVDEGLKLHLLDINEHPTWSRHTSVLSSVKSNLWREATCLASEISIRYKTGRTISDDSLVARQNFRMVYSSEDPSLARRSVTLMYD